MSAEALVVVDGISRYFGDLHAIDNLSMEIGRGEIVGFLGPNGAGKSTAMQIICGALAPSTGTITIGGRDLFNEPRAAKRQIGYLPETPPLYTDLTVDEYLDFCARLRGVSTVVLRAAREQVKQQCAITDCGRRLIRNLSKGYRQRVGIAQAIIHAPQVVVLDEPTEGLDPNQRREIRSLIQELGREHSVILSTHVLPEVQAVCQRVLVLHEGRLVFDRSLAALDEDGGGSVGTVRIEVKRPPAIEQWQTLPGVVAASSEDDERVLVEYDLKITSTDELAAHVVGAGWGLTEFIPYRLTLEEVFLRLTSGENEEEAAA